ncbi:MAG: NAD-dependent epimerase/dehydratase family protein [Spongiibacteraceae bacterium]
MRVLVFGAGGYIGSHLVRHLAASGHTVLGFVRNDKAARQVRDLGAEPVMGDLDEMPGALAHFDRVDAVIFAAQLMLEPEYKAMSAMLDKLEGSGKTLIFTSGTGVLSQRTDGDWSEDSFSDYDPIVPSKYIGARHDTENLVRAGKERGIRAIVVRPPMIWGDGGCPMVKAFASSAAKTGAVCYVGRGLNLYSSVHVDDLAELYRLVLDKGEAGALYHAVSGETNFRTIAEGIARTLNVPTRSVDFAEAVTIWDKFTALVALSVCSRSRSPRARKELGWAPNPDRLDVMEETRHPSLQQFAPGK